MQLICDRLSNKYSVPEMGDHLATIDIGRKLGAPVPIFCGGIGEDRKRKQLQGTLAQALTWNGPS